MMMTNILSVREFELSDLEPFISYWLNASASHLAAMGVEIKNLPAKEEFITYWTSQLNMPIEERQSYCVIWEKNGIAVGHSSTRPTVFGKEAYMHLHLWNDEDRRKGLGSEFVRQTLPFFFENLQIKDLYCEPFALNEAPNRTMQKVGFEFVKEYTTTPGPFNFSQNVQLWHLSRKQFIQLSK